MKQKTYHILSEIACFLFIGLFVYTATNKLLDHVNFREQLTVVTGNSFWGLSLSYFVPVAELVVAGLLCFQVTKLTGLYFFCGLFVLFSAYIVYLMAGDKPLPCSCGGIINKLSWRQHLIFNICVLCAGIATIFLNHTTNQASQQHLNKKSF